MNKLIKYSLIVGGILLVLVLVAIIVTPYLLNVDALREWGERQATSYIGREVTIEEAGFSWSGPKVKLIGFTIAGRDGAGDEPFARLGSFDLKLRLADLFRLRLSVEHVVLSEPRIRIMRDKDGNFNFDDILDHINTPAEVADRSYAAMAPSDKTVKAPPVDLLVEEIRVESGEIFFSDASYPRLSRGIGLQGIELTMRDLSLDRPVTVSASLGIGSDSRDVKFDGTLGPVGKVIVPGTIPFDLKLEILPFELTRLPQIIGPLPLGIAGVVKASETVSGSLVGGVNFEMDGSLEGLSVNGSDNTPLVRDFIGSINQKGRINWNNRSMVLDAFTMKAYQAVFEADGSVKNLGRSPLLDLKVRSNPVPLAGWEEVLPDLGSMLKLDGDLTFEGQISGTVGKDLEADLAFRSKRFEADRGPALMERSSSAKLASPGDSKPLEPVKAPPITVNGKVTVEEGRFERIPFTDLSAVMTQRESLFSLEELKLEAFSGRLSGLAWTDLGSLPLSYGTRMVMTGVQVNSALAAIANMEGIVYGKASMDISLEGKGTQFADLEKYLTGKGAIKTVDGRITSANLGEGAGKAASLLGIKGDGNETRFEDMDVSFTIKDGKVKVSDLRILTGEYALKAWGDIGLDRSLAMTSRMTLSSKKSNEIPENRRRLFPKEPDGRVQIPLKIGGKVTSPKFALDTSAMNEAVKEEVKKEVEVKKEKLKEKIQKDLQDKLKNLF